MRTYHSQPSRQAHWSHLQYVLFALISLSLVVITILLFVIAQMGPGSNGQYPTPVVVVSPTASPGPTFSPTPTPSPSPTPTSPPPSPTPPPPPGVLGYPLYRGNPELPEIALTFDDGPGPVYTAQILTILKQEGVRATYFVIGSNASRYPELVSQEVQQGHVVGNHTWSHSNLRTCQQQRCARNCRVLQARFTQIAAFTRLSSGLLAAISMALCRLSRPVWAFLRFYGMLIPGIGQGQEETRSSKPCWIRRTMARSSCYMMAGETAHKRSRPCQLLLLRWPSAALSLSPFRR